MKNLNTIFDLLLFPFLFLKRKKLLFSLLFLTGTTLFAASNSPTISISPDFHDINESSGTITVNLDINISEDANTSDINVTWETVDGSATVADGNYDYSTGMITFAKGTSTNPSSISIAITVNSDILIGSDIAFTVELTQIDTNASQSYTTGITVATIRIINNDPPTANNKTYQVDVNSQLTGNIITDAPADTDPEGDTTTVAEHNSTFTINSDGSFTYDPATDFCGIYSFDYNITDGIEVSNTATVTIDVRNILQNPKDDSYLINRVDQTLYGNVISNDPNQNYTVTGFSTPSDGHGTVTLLDSNGSFEYVPDNSHVGDVTFDYTVSDGTTCSTATATVTIKITDMCNINNIIPFDLCAGPIPDTIVVDDPQVYSFELSTSVILDLNLTNTGKKLLEYDFRAGDCDSLFAEETTSYLPQGANIDIKKEYPAATYFLGLGVGQNETDILLSICYDTNISGNDGQAYSHIGINDINSTLNSNDWYDIFPNITTKVVNKPFDIRASYLDENQETAEYDGRFDKNGEVGMSVILSMAQGNCEKIDNAIVATMILDHAEWYEESVNTIINIPYAAKNRQLHITSFDFGALFRAATGLNCGNSSLNSSLCLLPACFNTISNIKAVFPPAFYPNVLICVNGDGGGLAPCDSRAYTGGCGGVKGSAISPSIYNNDYGCASCLQDAMELNICSDTFAIRPDKFEVKITDPDFPNLLRAGQEYGVSLTALDAEGNDTITGYTITSHNFNDDLAIDTTKYFRDGTKDDPLNPLLHGTPDLNKSITAYMLTGFSSLSPTTRPTSAEEIVKVSYDDVGKVELHIYDFRWAEIDNKDTPMDCNSTEHTYICGDKNVTFIPDHFRVENIHLRNHNDGEFTYLSNDLNMSAHIDVNISAMNAKDDPTKDINISHITQNFKQGSLYYEHNMTVDLNVTEWNTSITPSTRHPKGNLVHKHDIPTETLLGFGGSDADGTHLIPWNETNTTQQLMFNYTREYNQTVNPFMVDGTDINITVQSTYTDSITPSSPAIITGTGISDRNATFYFARTKSSKFFYDDETSPATTPISVVIYNEPGSPFNLDLTLYKPTNEYDWYLSTPHNYGNNDGNVTLEVTYSSTGTLTDATVTPEADNPVNLVNGVDPSVTVASNVPNIRPHDVNISFESDGTLADTNTWMIYNPTDNSIPNPFYRVRFHNTAGWAGHGDTGNVVNSDASTIKNKRLGW